MRDLDSITDKDIIDFYNMLLNNHYKTILFGDFNKEQKNKILNKIKFNGINNSKIDYKEAIEFEKGYNEFVSKEFTQSVLFMTYKIKNPEKYSTRWYNNAISCCMSGLDGFLLQQLRYKYGLVYSCGSSLIEDSDVYIIQANIDKKNKDKTIEAVREMLKDLKNIDTVEKRLALAKSKIKERTYLSSELSYSIYGTVWDCIYKNGLTEKEFIEKINKIQAKDIVDFFSNLDDENIFFYVGDKDE